MKEDAKVINKTHAHLTLGFKNIGIAKELPID